MKYPLYLAVLDSLKSKVYPKRVKMFLGGLQACLMMQQRFSTKDTEKLVFFVYRTAYALGAAEYGGDMETIQNEMPNFGLDQESPDLKR